MYRSTSQCSETKSVSNSQEGEENIYTTKTLTSMKGDLLRQTKECSKEHNYTFLGFIVNGEIRVKKLEPSK